MRKVKNRKSKHTNNVSYTYDNASALRTMSKAIPNSDKSRIMSLVDSNTFYQFNKQNRRVLIINSNY